ncbi:Uncharacterised protein [Mycobacterium tuberculosis]|nr:Uncharacterised protein [Mycobacterium tuberculosis]
MPARPSVSAAGPASSGRGAPTVATGTSVQPYTRVTTARAKYCAARRISDGDTEAPPQMNTFRSGRRLPVSSAADSSCCRNGVAPAIWVQRSVSISATARNGSHRSISTAVVPSSSGHSKA